MNGSERLKSLLEKIGKTQREFAKDVGLTQGTVSDIVRGKTTGLSETAAKLCRYLYNVNPEWLITGEGEMFISNEFGRGDALNKDLLKIIITTVMATFEKEGLEMRPDKFAEFILFMYDRHKDKREVSEKEIKDNVVMLKKFA